MKKTRSLFAFIFTVSLICQAGADTGYEEINKEIRPHDHLALPEGNGPFPVVIILHTAEGPTKMDREWARILSENGIAGLVVKSYPGFIGDSTRARAFNRLKQNTPSRVEHVLATLDYLKSRSWADTTRIILLGRSHGAWTALWFLATEMTADDNKGVRGIVAYYPDCDTGQPYTDGWTANVPVFIQMGRYDPVTSRVPCIKMADEQKALGRPVVYAVYKNRGHNIDMGNDKNARQARTDTLAFIRYVLSSINNE